MSKTDYDQHGKPLLEKCGIVGIYTNTPSRSLSLALVAAGGVQHRGQQGAGLVLKLKNKTLKFTGTGLLKEVFTPPIKRKYDLASQWLLLHCRYGTSGGYDTYNLQPCETKAKSGEVIHVIHNGEFAGVSKMRQLVKSRLPKDASDTYIFTRLLAQQAGSTWDDKITRLIEQLTGAFSLIITVGDVMYIVRDKWGIRPLFLGKLANGWLVASETHAFDKASCRVTREIYKGEILKIESTGIKRLKKGTSGAGNFCDFEWAYFSRPNSFYQTSGETPISSKKWLSTGVFRETCGVMIAKRNPIPHATFVVGVPDSGIHVAMGYAGELRLPYRQLILRDHYDADGAHRLFMKDDEMTRIKKKVLGKLSFVADIKIWKDAIVVLGDDSIVRGNVASEITEAIFRLGAREVHWVVGFPPVMHPCHLGVSMRTQKELVAPRYGADPKKIAKEIGASSVNYITPLDFVKAKHNGHTMLSPKDQMDIFLQNGGCGGCITGKYPVAKDGTVHYIPN